MHAGWSALEYTYYQQKWTQDILYTHTYTHIDILQVLKHVTWDIGQ